MKERTYISFDWALKRLLRDKANFDVLEGFLTTILGREVTIKKLLEGEGNKDRDDAKYNRDDQVAYDRYLMDRAILRNTMTTARDEGWNEGRAEGRAEGREEGRSEGRKEGMKDVARRMKQKGFSDSDIAQMTGLSVEELADVLK